MGIVDKAKARAQVLKGHSKVAAGKATDDKGLVAEGKADLVLGNLKRVGEKVKETFASK